jgi:hypothetical protein
MADSEVLRGGEFCDRVGCREEFGGRELDNDRVGGAVIIVRIIVRLVKLSGKSLQRKPLEV